jgi:hypothetical protein
MRLVPTSIVLAAALAVALPAAAQTPPDKGTEKKPGPAADKPKLDETGVHLAERTDALAVEAKKVFDAYRKAMEQRIAKLADGDPTLSRLHDAGVFNIDALLAGVADDPLAGLPEIREVYERLDKTAEDYINQYGGVAKAKAVAAAADYMRKVMKAQETYHDDDRDGNNIPDYALFFFDLGQLGLLHVPKDLKRKDTQMVAEGYTFRILHADQLRWAADAAPVKAETTSTWLYADETGTIRAETGKPAGPKSPELKVASK